MVGEDVCVVKGALTDTALVIHELPRPPCVIAAEKATVVVLEERVDDIRVRARDRQPDPSDHTLLRHAGVPCHLRPRFAAVRALEHTATGAARRHRVFLAEGFP